MPKTEAEARQRMRINQAIRNGEVFAVGTEVRWGTKGRVKYTVTGHRTSGLRTDPLVEVYMHLVGTTKAGRTLDFWTDMEYVTRWE